jgi:hypothetical protein
VRGIRNFIAVKIHGQTQAGNKVNHGQVTMVGSRLLEVCGGGKNLNMRVEFVFCAQYQVTYEGLQRGKAM